MRIIVTGGAGFIGSALVHHLLDDTPHEVTVLDAMTYAAVPMSLAALLTHPRLTVVRGDISDADAVKAVLESASPDVLVNLAAETHVDRSIAGPEAFIHTNVLGTYHLLEQTLVWWKQQSAARKAGFRFHHVSTDEVFGSLESTGRFSEVSAYDPRSPYAASKASSDHLVRAWGHTYGLPVLITNCSNNYGPRQFPEKLIPVLISRALAGAPLPIYGDGAHVRDWLHVEDHVRALRTVFEKGEPGTTYLIGGDCERSTQDVAQAVCLALDRQCPRPAGQSYSELITRVEDRPGHDRRYAVDASLFRTTFGWQPVMDFEDGIARTVRWYLDNRSWWEPCLKAP